jgi:predicted glycosyltransferase
MVCPGILPLLTFGGIRQDNWCSPPKPMLKIWFDLSNSPHVNLFSAMIRDLQSNHEITITCRPLANTIDLLKLHHLPHSVVGVHYGGSFGKKVLGYPVRVRELYRFLSTKGIHLAVSQSSFHSPVVASLLRVPSIYMNDNEHALGNVPSFVFASKIMVPEFLSPEKLRKQLADPKKVVHYPGVKEGIYLWNFKSRLDGARDYDRKARPSVYIRPEPWTAQYYKGRRNFLDDLILGLKNEVSVTLLPRGRDQGDHYRSEAFSGIRIIDTALNIEDIVLDCSLFIGAGGTMTREMAILGIPTISVYQDDLLDVDRFLLDRGAFIHSPNLTAKESLAFLDQARRRPPSRDLLDKGKAAYDMIKAAVLEEAGKRR